MPVLSSLNGLLLKCPGTEIKEFLLTMEGWSHELLETFIMDLFLIAHWYLESNLF